QSDDVDLVHAALPQPVGQLGAGIVDGFERAVGSGMVTLHEHCFDCAVVELWVKVDTRGADLAVPWPRLPVVGVLGEMIARVDVVVLAGDYVGVVAMGRDVAIDLADQRGATDDPKGTALTEVVLN